MIHTINDLSVNAVYNREDLLEKIPVLFLHGFTGCSDDWDFLVEKLPPHVTPIFVDLIGHGKSSSPIEVEKYSSSSQIEVLSGLIQKLSLKSLILVGYSMGGRLALSFTDQYPNKVMALVLESTSFGLETKNESEERIDSDTILAQKINKSSMSEFIDYWMKRPLFDSLNKLSSQKLEELKRKKIEYNSSIGLSNSLIGFSTGRMKNFFTDFKKFKIQVLLITGSLDCKFTSLASKANMLLPCSESKIVDDCGHNVHFEKPEEFLKLLNSFLLNIRDYK